MIGKGLIAAAALALTATSVDAETLDFTVSPPVTTGTVLGSITWTLEGATSTGGPFSQASVNFTETSTGSTCVPVLGLACSIDGGGVGDDEVTSIAVDEGEALRLTFSAPVRLTEVFFLDLLANPANDDFEVASLLSEGSQFDFEGVEERDGVVSGALREALAVTLISDTFIFTAFDLGTTNDGFPFNSFALAGVSVLQVPVPAAFLLFGSVLAGAGVFRWSRRREPEAA